MADIGRPEYTDEEYASFLEDMKPFLKQGASLHYAMERSGLLQRKDSIYRKYRLGDWFCEKVDIYRSYVGELTNNVFALQVQRIFEKQKTEQILTREEIDILKFVAEKHRTAQPFFANRNESAEAPPVGKILDELERNATKTDYSKLGSALAEQGVAPNPPVQDPGQADQSGDVSTEPNPA